MLHSYALEAMSNSEINELSESILRLDFAKQLAAAAFAARQRHRPQTSADHASARWAQAKRSAQLVADPREDNLYTVDIEQERARSFAVSGTSLPKLKEICNIYASRRSLSMFLQYVMKELERALWRCDVYIDCDVLLQDAVGAHRTHTKHMHSGHDHGR